ncbi:protein REVEILLE 1-like protein isoform X2 [Tanacetum coccineum]
MVGQLSSMDSSMDQFYDCHHGFPSIQDHSEGSVMNTVWKPYTITKQRESWTEEEHKKFIEALRLYGRAWRRIEEHVVRESTSGNACEVKPIEIPPPRPKRKPMHPYPRKLSAPVKMGGHHGRYTPPNLLGSDQEN